MTTQTEPTAFYPAEGFGAPKDRVASVVGPVGLPAGTRVFSADDHISLAEDIFYDTSLGPSIAPTVRRLADLAPRTLTLMHGSSFVGDTVAALHDLASAYDGRLRAAMAGTST